MWRSARILRVECWSWSRGQLFFFVAVCSLVHVVYCPSVCFATRSVFVCCIFCSSFNNFFSSYFACGVLFYSSCRWFCLLIYGFIFVLCLFFLFIVLFLFCFLLLFMLFRCYFHFLIMSWVCVLALYLTCQCLIYLRCLHDGDLRNVSDCCFVVYLLVVCCLLYV